MKVTPAPEKKKKPIAVQDDEILAKKTFHKSVPNIVVELADEIDDNADTNRVPAMNFRSQQQPRRRSRTWGQGDFLTVPLDEETRMNFYMSRLNKKLKLKKNPDGKNPKTKK